MKRGISLIIGMALCTIFAQAQQKTFHSNKTSFGFRAGVNFQNINGKDEEGDKLKNDILTGFNFGFNAEIPVAPDFYFQPGVLFTTKGAKNEEIILGQPVSSRIKISYVEIPLNFLYKPLLGTGHLLLGVGPYVAFGVGGNIRYEGSGFDETQDIKFQNTVKTTDADNVAYLRRMDAGANLLAGYEFSNKISVQLNTQLGLTKINPEYEGASDDKTVAKNTGFGFSLGYRF